MKRLAAPGAGALAGLVIALASFALASADTDGSVAPAFSGPCTAQAQIQGFGSIDPAASGGVYTVPKSGSASYIGVVNVSGEDRVTSGKVEVALPGPLPGINIKSWSGDDTDGTSDSGTVTWDLPGWLPGNIEMKVSGFHQDEGARCEGSIIIKLDGSGLASGAGLGMVGLTIIAIAGVAWAGVPK